MKGFYKTNHSKPFISTRVLLENLSELLSNRGSSPYSQLRQDLLALLVQAFSLQTHAFTDSWNFSPLFGDWTSINSHDVPFGSKLWFTATMHEGCNAFFVQPPNNNIKIQGLMEILMESLESRLPSRFVLVIPKQASLPKEFLELASFDDSHSLFTYDPRTARTVTPCAMSLILAANKESMARDPINWEIFRVNLQTWAQDWAPDLLTIPHLTDALFRERTHLQHSPRALSNQPLNVFLSSTSSINFYDAFASRTSTTLNSIPFRAAELIRNANRHPHFLGVLGILPNQLRTLLKESGHEGREEALIDISRTLFFAGFRVWTKRQQLNSVYWNDIAPENRKIKASKRKKHTSEKIASQSKCMNPFHFLVRHSNLSKQRPTKCPCRNVSNSAKVYKTQAITEFIYKFPRIQLLSSMDNKDFMTRTDAIRKEHDRGKKRKTHDS